MKKLDNYYETILETVDALIEKGEFDKANNILKQELQMPYTPRDYLIKLSKKFDLTSKKILAKQNKKINSLTLSAEEIETRLLDKTINEEELFLAVIKLTSINVRKILPTLKKVVNDKNFRHIFRVLVFDTLVQQGIDEKILFLDYQNNISAYYPSKIPVLSNLEQTKQIAKILELNLEDDIPVVFRSSLTFLENYIVRTYPVFPEKQDFPEIAAACAFLASKSLSQEISLVTFLELFSANHLRTEAIISVIEANLIS